MFPIRDHNPSRHRPYVTYGLIAINVAVYLWTLVAIQTDPERCPPNGQEAGKA